MISVKNMRNLVVIVLKSEDHPRAGSEVVSLSVFFFTSWFEKKPADGYDLCSERMIAK